jgi:hypothetical protein
MRLRTTAPPNAFLMLNPNRLSGSWFTRKKTVKWELDRRFPVRYTASNSPLRTSRAARGKSRRPSLLGREPMTSLLAARRQHLAAALRLHAHAEAVRLRATPLPRLISPLWQSTPPFPYVSRGRAISLFRRANDAPSARADRLRQAGLAVCSESVSVFDSRSQGQENRGVAYSAGKSDTPACYRCFVTLCQPGNKNALIPKL